MEQSLRLEFEQVLPSRESIKIAKANDRFRGGIKVEATPSVSGLLLFALVPEGGRVILSRSINPGSAEELDEIMSGVRNFRAFDGEMDPYGEHDMGIFRCPGQLYAFKFAYHFPDTLEEGADPVSDDVYRVLHIMPANELSRFQ